jgi:hypothetical protein
MSRPEISERVKYSISIEMEVPSYEFTRYLPDSLVVRFDKKEDRTKREGIQGIEERYKQLVRVDNKVQNDGVELDKKLKLFIDIFRALAGDDRNDVKKESLVDELINTGKYTEEEAIAYLKKAQQYGFIFERKVGMYALA